MYELQSALKSSETDYIQKVKNIYTISGRKNKLTKVFTILLLLASCCPLAPTSPSPRLVFPNPISPKSSSGRMSPFYVNPPSPPCKPSIIRIPPPPCPVTPSATIKQQHTSDAQKVICRFNALMYRLVSCAMESVKHY